MGSKDWRALAEGSGELVHYQQGKRTVAVEPLGDTVALRSREGKEEAVSEALRSFRRVDAVNAPLLHVIELPEGPERQAALDALRRLEDDGALEFVTPVLRDRESQLHQILTDEITVRFKAELSPEELKRIEEKYGLTAARRNEFVPRQLIMKVEQPIGLHPLEVAAALDGEEEVEFAAPNFISEFRKR